MRGKKGGFTLIEALMAIGAMTVATAAILSVFLTSSDLRIFSENFTIGINACQEALEEISYRYEKDSDPATHLRFKDIIDGFSSEVSFNPVLNPNGSVNAGFAGVIISSDPKAGEPEAGRVVEVTARVAFRQGRRIVGGTVDASGNITPSNDSPCQLTITIVNRD